jgi:hypothetical protein
MLCLQKDSFKRKFLKLYGNNFDIFYLILLLMVQVVRKFLCL